MYVVGLVEVYKSVLYQLYTSNRRPFVFCLGVASMQEVHHPAVDERRSSLTIHQIHEHPFYRNPDVTFLN